MTNNTNLSYNQLVDNGWKTYKEITTEFGVIPRTIRKWCSTGKLVKVYASSDNNTLVPLFKENGEVELEKSSTSHKSKQTIETKEIIENVNKPYYYDSEKDKYAFFNFGKDKNKIKLLDGSIVRGIVEEYANNDIDILSVKFSLQREIVAQIIKTMEITKTALPLTPEELENEDLENLIEKVSLLKYSSIKKESNSKYLKILEQKSKKLDHIQEMFNETFMNGLQEAHKSYKVSKISLTSTKNDKKFTAMLTPTDLHYGKQGWIDEVGEEYNREITKERLIEKTQDILKMILKQGTPEKFIVGAGSDWFNCDSYDGKTTGGTTQDNDGTFAQIFQEGSDLAVTYIDMLRQIAPVEIIPMEGNHDRIATLSLVSFLYAWYRNCEDVVVHRKPRHRFYLKYGNNLIGLTHGDKPELRRLPALMANEERQNWGLCKNRFWFTGDKHHELTLDHGGCMIYQMPSLSGEDRWHSKNGYTYSRKSLHAYLIDKEEGIFAIFNSPVKNHH